MFTIMTHFMVKHVLEDDEMFKNGLAVKGLIKPLDMKLRSKKWSC